MHYFPFAFPIILAFANRFRGGWLPTGHTELTRAIFAAIWAVVLVPYIGWWAVAAFVAVFIGSLVGHARFMGLASLSQYIDLGVTGLFNFAPLSYVLMLSGYPHAVDMWFICSVGKTAAYALGKYLPIGGAIPNFEQGPPLGEFFFWGRCGRGFGACALTP